MSVICSLLLALAGIPSFASPLTPAHGIHSWVAGFGPGYRDGSIDQARFGEPAGILFDASRDRLYVADTSNAAIRVVYLGENNRVGTLGKGDAADLSTLKLVGPTALDWLEAGKRLVVLDPAAGSLGIIDLATGRPVAGTQAEDLTATAFLRGAQDIQVQGDSILVAAGAAPQFALFSVEGGVVKLARAWTVQGIPVQSGVESFSLWNGRLLALHRDKIAGASFFEVRDETNAYPGLRMGKADRPLPVSMSAVPLTSEGIKEPWAFVKDGEPFSLVTHSPALAVWVDPRPPLLAVARDLGVYDKDDRLIGVEDDQLFDQEFHSVWKDPFSAGRRWLANAAAAGFDPATLTWYISDPANHRIMSFRTVEFKDRNYFTTSPDGFFEWSFPPTRRPDTTRIAIMNLSRLMQAGDTHRHSNAFSRRMEHHLNMMNSLRGESHNYEVFFAGAGYSYEPDGMSSLGQLRCKWDRLAAKVAPDELLVVMGPMDLYQTALDYRMRPIDAEGLPEKQFDPDFALSPDERKLAPGYRALCKVIKSNPAAYGRTLIFDKKGMMVNVASLEAGTVLFNTDPVLFETAHSLLRPYLVDLRDKAAMGGGPNGGPVKVTIIYYPDANGISQEETTYQFPPVDPEPFGKVLEKDCKALGIGFIDICGETRLFAAEDPFMEYRNVHPNARGQDDLAYIVAWRWMEAREGTGVTQRP